MNSRSRDKDGSISLVFPSIANKGDDMATRYDRREFLGTTAALAAAAAGTGLLAADGFPRPPLPRPHNFLGTGSSWWG